MNVLQLRQKLSEFGLGLLENELALDVNEHIVSTAPGGRRTLTWAGFDAIRLADLRQHHQRAEEYLVSLRDRNFSFVMVDGALIQISYIFLGNRPVYHRLAYHPCPYDVTRDFEFLAEYGLLDYLEEIAAFGSVADVRLRSPIRFDYDPDSAGTYHPAAHVTTVASSCRIPLLGRLMVDQFLGFICEHFYPEALKVGIAAGLSRISTLPPVVSDADRARIHLSWPIET